MDSSQIAQSNSMFTSMYAGMNQYAQSIGQGMGYGMNSQMHAEGLTGMMGNQMMARGAPAMRGAMGMLGMDPMSLGLKSAMGAWSGGAGVMGAGMAGMGGIVGGGVAAMGVGYAANQMYSGMQQQQQLNQTLRSNFTFQRPGGQGFDSSQMAQIGGGMREMTHQFGPGGEVTGFKELTQLAGKMGQMGMMQGVKDVQDFSKKFKEMTTALKTMAKDLGTTMEGALEFAQASKGSGIFGAANAQRFAGAVRGTAAAGGLAISEVTSMANIGSQISRSVGGLGKAGATGGMRTIGQLGAAMQSGVLSEEDLYNATGLSGAEGRQAMATRQMEQSASFLKGGRGRRFLASIAGKNGQVDEESLAQYMSGGDVSTGRTMQMAHKNLAGVGRANFLRNEGHLRGAALEKLGGLAMPMIYKQWLAERGWDPSQMGDKEMLAFTRFSGLGQDEATLAMKEVQNLPKIMQEMKRSEKTDKYNKDLSQQRGTRGIEGAKKKLEQVREKISTEFETVGQNIWNSLSEGVERWMNGLTDSYEHMSSKAMNDAMKLATSEGDSSKLTQLTQGLTMGAASSGKASQFTGESSIVNSGSAYNRALGKGDFSIFKPETSGGSNVTEYTSQFRTAGERKEAYGGGFGKKASGVSGWGVAGWAGAGAVAGSIIPGLGTVAGALGGAAAGTIYGIASGVFGKESTLDASRGEYLESDESMGITRDLFGSQASPEKKAEALKNVRKQLEPLENKLRAKGELSGEDRAKYDVLRTQEAGAGLQDLATQYGSVDKIPSAEKNKFKKRYAMSVEEAQTGAGNIVAAASDVQRQQEHTALLEEKNAAKDEAEAAGKAGLLDTSFSGRGGTAREDEIKLKAFLNEGTQGTGEPTDAREGVINKLMSGPYGKLSRADAEKMAATMSGYAAVTSGVAAIHGTKESRDSDIKAIQDKAAFMKETKDQAYSKTPEQLRNEAKAAREAGQEGLANLLSGVATSEESYSKSMTKRGKAGAMNAALGIDPGGEDAKAIAAAKTPRDKAILRLKAAGIDTEAIKDPAAKDKLINDTVAAAKATSEGKAGAAAKAIGDVKDSVQWKDKEAKEIKEKEAAQKEKDKYQIDIASSSKNSEKWLQQIAKKTMSSEEYDAVLKANKDTEAKK